jgi:YggT family protein
MSPFDLIITTVAEFLSLLIIADALLSFVLPPTHAIREAIGRILQPIYAPIRRILPPMGMFDFTPIVVLLLIQVLVIILTSIL